MLLLHACVRSGGRLQACMYCTRVFVRTLGHADTATEWLLCLLLLFHKRVWKSPSQHTGIRGASAGSGSGHTSANTAPVCVYASPERERVHASCCIYVHVQDQMQRIVKQECESSKNGEAASGNWWICRTL